MENQHEVLYQVAIVINKESADIYKNYMLEKHIADMKNTGCFIDATLTQDLCFKSDVYNLVFLTSLGQCQICMSIYCRQKRKN